MRPGKHAQSAVITYTVGTMVGALCLAAERSGVPYALVMAFAVGPAILVARWTLAHWSLRALKRDAKKAGAAWPEGISVRDGWLCYKKDGFAWFRTPPLRRTDRDCMLSAPPFVDPEPLMASVAQVMDESRRQHERSFASMEATAPDSKPDHEGPRHEILQRLTDTSPALVNFPSSFIRLSNGEFFDLAAPDFDGRTNQGLIAPILMGLAQQPRFAGQAHAETPEDVMEFVMSGKPWMVLQHQCLAAWCAWLIDPNEHAFIRECGLHDGHESIFGDMPSPLKSLCHDYKAREKTGAHEFRRVFHLPGTMTSAARVVDGLCLVAEARMLHGDWPDDWASHDYIIAAQELALHERAKWMRGKVPMVLAARATLDLLNNDMVAVVDCHIAHWELLFQEHIKQGSKT